MQLLASPGSTLYHTPLHEQSLTLFLSSDVSKFPQSRAVWWLKDFADWPQPFASSLLSACWTRSGGRQCAAYYQFVPVFTGSWHRRANECPANARYRRESSPILGRSSPSSPKSEVWRMLYVDPDVADPKLVAGRLEVAASMVLRSGCVFDVATDIVQALADVRGDTMSLYRAVFINETLQRHRKSAQSIEGKNLAQFFRQAGMSAARIVLLVAGDVQFDTADAGAHGLSAVLRKPFTRDGFCDVLRGMYLSGDPTIEEVCTAPEELGQPPQPAPPPKERSPCLACGSTPSSCVPHQPVYPSVNRLPLASNMKVTMDHSTGSAAAAAIAAAARAATVRPGAGVLTPPPPSFPDCLGFTPFPPAMIEQLRRYPMVARFSCPGTAPRRKYTKIAPREEEESATPKASSETASSHSSSTKPETPATSGLAGDKIQQGLSPLLAGAADSEVRSDSSGAGCDHPREALEASEDS